MNKSSRILVAGSTGLIGSAFSKYFKNHNFNKVLYTSSNELDLTRRDDVIDFFRRYKPEYVFLTAGKVAGILENNTYPADFIQKNLVIQSNVFEVSSINNVRKLVFYCSSCMYPKKSKQPMSEEFLLTGIPEPTSISYAIAKLSGLYSCLAYNRQLSNQIYIPVIPNSAYGPHDNFDPDSAHVLSSLIYKFFYAKINNSKEVILWGSGKPKREFIFVDDIVDASIFLIKKNLEYLPLNIGSGEELSIRSLAMMIAKKIGFKGKILWDKTKPDGAMRKLLDSKKIRELGWKPKIKIDKGLDLTIEWFYNNYDQKIKRK